MNSLCLGHGPIILRKPSLASLGEIMEYFAELMQRLLEIQHGGKQRSSKLIAENAQLIAALRKRTLAGKSGPIAKDVQGGQAQFQS